MQIIPPDIITADSDDFARLNDRFQLLSVATKEGIWEYDFESKKSFYNQGMKDMWGYTNLEMEDNNAWWRNNIHPQDKKRIINELDELMKGKETVWWGKYQFKTQNGSYKLILDRLFIVRDTEGKPLRMIGTMQDLTELNKIENDLEAIRKEDRKTMFREMFATYEKERKGISEELHENINQVLAMIRMHLAWIEKYVNPEGMAEIKEAQNLLLSSMTGIRAVSERLFPLALDTLGFKPAMQKLLSTLQKNGLPEYNIKIDAKAMEKIKGNKQTVLYRIAEQQIKNIGEHSNAANVLLKIEPYAGKVKMSIYDDGQGAELTALKYGYGFSSIQEITEAFDGSFNLKTVMGKQGFLLEVII